MHVKGNTVTVVWKLLILIENLKDRSTKTYNYKISKKYKDAICKPAVWYLPIVLAPGRLRQEDYMYELNLVYIARIKKKKGNL
jgi:hypothetical protein